MIGRYLLSGQTKYKATIFGSTVAGSGTSTTQNYTTSLSGEPGAVVTLKVTTYTHTSGGAVYKLNGTSHILDDTVNIALDGSGNASFTQFIDVGTSTTGNAIVVTLTIESTSIGPIGVANTDTISKTI